MKARLEDKNRAIELRRQGLSYKEIQAVVPVSKGLLSGWFSHIHLTNDEEKRLKIKLEERRSKGKMSSKILNQARMLERQRRVAKEAELIFKNFKSDIAFMLGITLFWANGSKNGTDFNFISSDTDMVFIMFTWVQKYLLIPKEKIKIRLYVVESPNIESIRGFWAKNLHIKLDDIRVTLQGKKPEILKNNPYYKGSIRINISGIRYLRLMKAWQRLLINQQEKALLSHK